MNRVLQSEQIDKLIAALIKAQTDIGHAVADSNNPHFNSRFASLENVIDVSKKPLLDNELVVVQQPLSDEIGTSLVTTIAHVSGQWIRSYTPIQLEKQTYQSLGSGISYMRRYSLAAILNIGQEDDDGNKATENQVNKKPENKPANKPLNKPVRKEPKHGAVISFENPWNYKVRCGQKYKGSPLSELMPHELTGYVDFIKHKADPGFRDSEEAQEFLKFAELALKTPRGPNDGWQNEEFPA